MPPTGQRSRRAALHCGYVTRAWGDDGWPLATFLFSLMRLDILIQAEEVAGIILRLYRDHALPSVLVSFGDPVLLVAVHEIYVNAGFHGRPQLLEERADPGRMQGI